MQWLGEKQIPFVVIFTKIDKLSKSKLENNLEVYKTEMLKNWEEMPETFLSSAEKSDGKDQILKFICKTNDQIKSML